MEKLLDYLKKIGVLKSEVLISAFQKIDRADFVPEEIRESAYVDEALPIGEGQTISQPYTVAFMLELLDPRPGEKIMDIGAGSGWQTAILAHVAGPQGKIFAIERLPALCEFGKNNISKYDFIEKGVVEWYCQNASNGLPDKAQFDKIIAAANIGDFKILKVWGDQLKIGGIIVAPIGSSVWKFTKEKDGAFKKEEFPGFVFVPFIYPVKSKTIEPSVDASARQTSDKNKMKILSILVGILFLSGIFYYLFFYPSREFSEKDGKIFHVKKGENLSEISQNLKNEGFIKNTFVFKTFFSLTAGENKVKAGDYFFEKPLSVREIKNRLAEGYGLVLKKITISEGWTVKDIGFYFENLGMFQAEEFYALFAKDEGYLFPDTYFFDANDLKPEIIAKTMRENFKKKITPEIMAEIKQQGKNLKEIIIMASLIEKEAADAGDRRAISDILWKRLKIRMPLQVDAALTYAIGKTTFELTEGDLKTDSPYNTYVNYGLPPTAIANPGMDAITAAIYPKKTGYLYYLSDKEGNTYFAENFEEHKQNKFKYLR